MEYLQWEYSSLDEDPLVLASLIVLVDEEEQVEQAASPEADMSWVVEVMVVGGSTLAGLPMVAVRILEVGGHHSQKQ